MDINFLLGKNLTEAKKIIDENFKSFNKIVYFEILSPKKDVIGTDERVIKVEKSDDLIIYYSLF